MKKAKEEKKKYEKKKMPIKDYIFFLQSRRDYSYKEIYDKLIKREEDPKEIEKELKYMQKEGYQSDERMASAYYKSRQSRKGDRMISYELKSKGISDEIIKKTIEELSSKENNIDNAYRLIENFEKYDLNDKKIRDKAYRRILSKGFSFEEVKRAWDKLIKKNIEN